jgi:hypothetical protein
MAEPPLRTSLQRVQFAVEEALCRHIDYLKAPREHTVDDCRALVNDVATAAVNALFGETPCEPEAGDAE